VPKLSPLKYLYIVIYIKVDGMNLFPVSDLIKNYGDPNGI